MLRTFGVGPHLKNKFPGFTYINVYSPQDPSGGGSRRAELPKGAFPFSSFAETSCQGWFRFGLFVLGKGLDASRVHACSRGRANRSSLRACAWGSKTRSFQGSNALVDVLVQGSSNYFSLIKARSDDAVTHR